MKLASVLAGATAVALALTATAASAGPVIYQGAVNIGGAGNVKGTLNTTGMTVGQQIANTAGLAAVGLADLADPGVNSNIALFTISSQGFAANTSAASTTNGATFSLSGNVTPDCAYYFGNADTNVNFGDIGINTSDNNPDAAFEMVGGDRTLEISSNLAGCNTRNTVTFSKTDLSTSASAGFDPLQFTNVIPVQLSANFTAGDLGTTSGASLKTVNLTQAGNQSAPSSYGAWKSPLNMVVTLKNPGKGLLAGSYTGTVGVTIVAN